MYRAIVSIKGTAPLSQSRQHETEKLDGERPDDYDKRTWREKCNYDDKGIVFVPAMAFKQAMDTSAKRLNIKDAVNGGKSTMTKHFASDVICEKNLSIGVHKNDMTSVRISANSDGIRGSGKRVPRTLPQIQEWAGQTSFLVMDEKVSPEMFQRVLEASGRSIGVGQFRPEKGGLNGRFEISKIKFEKMEI